MHAEQVLSATFDTFDDFFEIFRRICWRHEIVPKRGTTDHEWMPPVVRRTDDSMVVAVFWLPVEGIPRLSPKISPRYIDFPGKLQQEVKEEIRALAGQKRNARTLSVEATNLAFGSVGPRTT